MAIEKEYDKFVPTCDGCCETLPREDSFEEAKIAMKEEGWTTKLDRLSQEWVNYCPACQENLGG